MRPTLKAPPQDTATTNKAISIADPEVSEPRIQTLPAQVQETIAPSMMDSPAPSTEQTSPESSYIPQQPKSAASASTATVARPPQASSTPATMDYVLQNIREALEVKTTPHDLRWDDPHFGEMQLRIDRQGGEVEVSIHSALHQTQETLKQHHQALAEELRLDPKQLRFDQGDSGQQEHFRGRQGDSQQSPFQERSRDTGPGSQGRSNAALGGRAVQARNAAKPSNHPHDSSLDLIA